MKMIVWFGFVLGALSAAGDVVVTKVGQKVSLECGVRTFSQLLEWSHKGSLVININGKNGGKRKGTGVGDRLEVRHGTKLEITGVTEADAGKFTCEADRKTYEHTLLVVSVSVVPSGDLQLGSEATLECQVKGLDPGSTVQWKSPAGQLHTELPTVQLNPVEASHAGVWKCIFTYGGTEYNEDVIITVKEPAPTTNKPAISKSPKESGKPACVDCVTDYQPDDAMQLLGLSWWVWLALGAGCLVVIFLIVVIIILCKRIRRRKRKFLKMKNAQQPRKPKKYCQCDCPTAAAKPQQGRRREKPSALTL